MSTPDKKSLDAIRDCLTQCRTHVCSYADLLDEPYKTQFNSLKKQYDDALAALPPTDQVPATMDANRILSSFASCLFGLNGISAMMGAEITRLKGASGTALNSAVDAAILQRVTAGDYVPKAEVETRIQAAITAKTTSGELVAKETVKQLCSDAKTTAFTEGETKVRTEVAANEARTKKIGERKQLLQTASLPLPEAALENALAGTDEEFLAQQTKVKARIAALQAKGVAFTPNMALAGKVYASDADWKLIEEMVTTLVAGGSSALATPAPAAGDAPFRCIA